MKKLLLFILITISSVFFAQTGTRNIQTKMLPAEVIFSGEDAIQNVQMKYEEPFIFSKPYYEFAINSTKYKSEYIVAFKINDKIWARRIDPSPKQEDILKDNLAGKTIHTTQAQLGLQGAIQGYIIYRTVSDGYIENTYIQKLAGPIKEIIDERSAKVRDETLTQFITEFVSDCPEITNELQQALSLTKANRQKMIDFIKADSIAVANYEKESKHKGLVGVWDEETFKKGRNEKRAEIGETEIDFEIIINNYNVWYDSQHPGKVTYYFTTPPKRQTSQMEKEMQLQMKVAMKKRAEAVYANRSTSVSAEYASAKNNEPVKKETFTAKLDRIKADGNKVGVLFIHNPVKSKPKSDQNTSSNNSSMGSSMGEDIYLEGEYMDESLSTLGKDFTEELKTALGRTDIELIDLKNIPYRNTRLLGLETRIDNCWATKYKVVFVYTIDPIIDAKHEGMSGRNKFEATLKFGSSLIVNEYIGDPESKEKDIITQMTSMGAFSSQKLTSDEDIMNIKQVYEKLVEKLSTPLAEKIKTERAGGVKKLVEKKLAP